MVGSGNWGVVGGSAGVVAAASDERPLSQFLDKKFCKRFSSRFFLLGFFFTFFFSSGFLVDFREENWFFWIPVDSLMEIVVMVPSLTVLKETRTEMSSCFRSKMRIFAISSSVDMVTSRQLDF